MWPILGSPPRPPAQGERRSTATEATRLGVVNSVGARPWAPSGSYPWCRLAQAPKPVAAHVCSRTRGRDAVRGHGHSSVLEVGPGGPLVCPHVV
jgi:hypothetical protein